MDNTYRNAVDHLIFSDTLYDDMNNRISKTNSKINVMRYTVAAAIIVILMTTTALASSPEFYEWTVRNLRLGVSRADPQNAQVMNFTVARDMDGVIVHYLKLDQNNYHFVHGMLYNNKPGFTAITDDYQLKHVETKQFRAYLEKNGRGYYDMLNYLETDRGIIDRRKSMLHENECDEVFLVLTDGHSNQWPAFVNLKTGSVRDALPNWTEDDFDGSVGYADQYKGGILVSTTVNYGAAANGNSVSDHMLYWIKDGSKEAILINLPEDEISWYCENDELYYKNNEGYLYRMNEAFEFELICDYRTGDELTNGLLAAATEDKKLVIVDAYNGNRYLVDDYSVDPGRYLAGTNSRFGCELDETMGVNATRYGTDGTIAVVRTEYIPHEQRVALKELGILDTNTGTLKMIEIENTYDGYRNGWLDEKRYAVIYKSESGDYLCIYEFK